jgi:hypothetical protein
MLDHIGCVSPGNAKPRPRDLVDTPAAVTLTAAQSRNAETV